MKKLRMKKYRIGKETFTIEKIHDEYLVTVRDQNDEPFVGADESLYELRIVIRPGYNTDMCLVAFEGSEEICDIFRDDKYINIAEALAAGWDLISEIVGPRNEPIIRLKLSGDKAKQLVYDPETTEALENENVILVIDIYPTIRYANFTYNIPEEIPNSHWEDLDYDVLIKDLLTLNR